MEKKHRFLKSDSYEIKFWLYHFFNVCLGKLYKMGYLEINVIKKRGWDNVVTGLGRGSILDREVRKSLSGKMTLE